MNIAQMHISLAEEVDKGSANAIAPISTERKDLWLNKAANKFKTTRYTGNNPTGTAYEQTEKRVDDLRTITIRSQGGVAPYSPEIDVYQFNIPSDYDFLVSRRFFMCEAECGKTFIDTTKYKGTLIKPVKVPAGLEKYDPSTEPETDPGAGKTGEEEFQRLQVSIIPVGNVYFGTKDGLFTGSFIQPTSVSGITCRWVRGKQVQHNDLRTLLEDPFNKPTPDRPLFFFERNQILIYCNPTFVITFIEITYLKKLIPMSNDVPLPAGFIGTSELPEHTHDDIVRIAAKMILENLSEPRYKTHTREVAEQE